MEVRGLLFMYCRCGHLIGVKEPGGAPFYDSGDRDKPITICPTCGDTLNSRELQHSDAQKTALVEAYRILLEAGRKAKKRGES
jgi:hypothetical protein